MSNNEEAAAPPSSWLLPRPLRDAGLTLKAAAAVALSIVALVPLMEVEDLVQERQGRQQAVIDEILSIWGGAQGIAGPYLEVPVTRASAGTGARAEMRDTSVIVLPADLNIDVGVQPEVRHRGIFEAVVYVADVTITGSFGGIDSSAFPDGVQTIDWTGAKLRLDVSDARSIRGDVDVFWNDSPVGLQLLAEPTTMPGAGDSLGADITLNRTAAVAGGDGFRIHYVVAGSGQLDLIPSGGSTTAKVLSPWNAPRFDGSFLPSTSDINADGFAATWAVSDYARRFPLAWLDSETTRYCSAMRNSAFGVELVEDVGLYRKTERAVKYGLLFFAVTFLTFLVLEVSSGVRLPLVHYGLVGAALCVFYVLLLSLAEVIGFPAAFAVSAAAVVAQISVFVWAVVRRARAAFVFAALLAAVYVYLYVLLDLEDMALLGGALGLFALLSVAMFALRGIGGVDPENPSSSPQGPP